MSSHLPTDFLVVCALDEEMQVLSDVFGVAKQMPEELYGLSFKSSLYAGRHVRIVNLAGRMGNLSAAVTCTHAIIRWRPWCVVSFGIAGGFHESHRVGDVVIAEQIIYYEGGKETRDPNTGETEIHPRIDFFPTSNSEFTNELARVKRAFAGEFAHVDVGSGIVASGEKKIADREGQTFKVVQGVNYKTAAIEMEAAGVAHAVRHLQSTLRPRLLVIKGISDDASAAQERQGDLDEEAQRERGIRRAAAGRHAAHFLTYVASAVGGAIEQPRRPRLPELEDIVRSYWGSLEGLIQLPGPRGRTRVMRQWKRILLEPISLPPLFCHWKVIHQHQPIHFIDFAYLLALRDLQDRLAAMTDHAASWAEDRIALPIHFLLADTDLEGSPQEIAGIRHRLELLIRAILGNSPAITWYSEVARRWQEYESWTLLSGLKVDLAEVERIRRTASVELPTDAGSLSDEKWLCYVAWCTQLVQRCIILIWHAHERHFAQLLDVLHLTPLILKRNPIELGGVLPKFQGPGRLLVVNPPGYPELLDYLGKGPADEDLAVLLRCLDRSGTIRGTPLEGLKIDGRMRERLNDSDWATTGRQGESILRLLALLTHLNAQYFPESVTPHGSDAVMGEKPT